MAATEFPFPHTRQPHFLSVYQFLFLNVAGKMHWEVLVLFLSAGKSHSSISDHSLHRAETQPMTCTNIVSKGSSLVFSFLFGVTKTLSALALLVVQLGSVVLVMRKYFSQMERLCNASQSQPDSGSSQYPSWQVFTPPPPPPPFLVLLYPRRLRLFLVLGKMYLEM